MTAENGATSGGASSATESLFSLRNLRRRPTARGGRWVNVSRRELDALLDVVEAAIALQGPDLSAWAFIGWPPNNETKKRIDLAFGNLEAASSRFADDA